MTGDERTTRGRAVGIGALLAWAVLTGYLFLRQGSDPRASTPSPDTTAVTVDDAAAVVPADAVIAEALSPPGTPIRDGWVVTEGSRLIANAVPAPEGGGWRALLYLTGDPREVFERYVTQGAGLGWQELVSDRLGEQVTRWSSPPGTTDTVARCASPPFGATFRCAAALARAGSCLRLDVERRSGDGSGLLSRNAISHVLLEHVVEDCEAKDVVGDPTTDPPPAPDLWAALPTQGERIFWAMSYSGDYPVSVVAGSTVAAASGTPGYGTRCFPATILMVSDSDSRAVFERYIADLRSVLPRPVEGEQRHERVEGATSYQHWQGTLTDARFTATMIQAAGRPSWIDLQRCVVPDSFG